MISQIQKQKAIDGYTHNEFIKPPKPEQIRIRNEDRFGLLQSDLSVKLPETIRQSITMLP